MKSLSILVLVSLLLFNASCKKSNPVEVNASKYHGSIFYCGAGEIHRLDLSDESNVLLFSNARNPEVITATKIMAIERYPIEKIVYTDMSGVNRVSLLATGSYTGPLYTRSMNKARLSKDGLYVAYEGVDEYNSTSHVFVIDANTGELLVTIGDPSKSQPMMSPSWAADGSLFVQGAPSINGGIYKVSPDFSSIVRVDPNLTNVSQPSVSPDGKMVAFIRDGRVWTMLADGSNATQFNSAEANYHTPTWSPDSKFIAAISRDPGHISIIDLTALTITEIMKSHYASDEQMCWRY